MKIFFSTVADGANSVIPSNKNGDGVLSLKVRISLPPSRAAPKRTAAERKSIIDEPLSDEDGEGSDKDDDGKKKKSSSPSKRGRPKKGASPKGKGGKNAKGNKEYEVQKIIDDDMRGGKKYYRIRWKGWTAKDDTWEPKASLSCPELIKAYESSKNDDQEYEVEKVSLLLLAIIGEIA